MGLAVGDAVDGVPAEEGLGLADDVAAVEDSQLQHRHAR